MLDPPAGTSVGKDEQLCQEAQQRSKDVAPHHQPAQVLTHHHSHQLHGRGRGGGGG